MEKIKEFFRNLLYKNELTEEEEIELLKKIYAKIKEA